MVLVWLLCHTHDPQVTRTLRRFYWWQTSKPWMGRKGKRGKGTTDFPRAWTSLTPAPDMVTAMCGCLGPHLLLNSTTYLQEDYKIRLKFIIVAILDPQSLHSSRRNVGGCCLKLSPEISLSISLKYVQTHVISKVCLRVRGGSLVSPYMTLILKTI